LTEIESLKKQLDEIPNKVIKNKKRPKVANEELK
jgi:hypothetical protein